MQLTKFTDYSLRVLIYLAMRRGEQATIREISDTHGISENHLMKVVHSLAKRGYLKTVRGKGGGISLARMADEVSIGSVIRELEPMTPVECFVPNYKGSCDLFPGCRLRGVLRGAQAAFLGSLDQYMLSDVAGPRRRAQQRVALPAGRRTQAR